MARKIVEQGLSTKSLEQETKGRSAPRRYFKVRQLSTSGTRKTPASHKEWRKVYRRLQTDLRRLERRESIEIERALKTIAQTRERLRAVRREANNQRRVLERELRRVMRHLAKT